MSAMPEPRMETPEEELVITRVFDAPRDLVWKMWTEPEHFKRWWGPKDFTTPYATIDLRPGGLVHYCMRSPEGQDYWGIAVIREIVEPERIVYLDSFSDEQGNQRTPADYGMSTDWPTETLVTVTFADLGGRTEMILHYAVPLALAETGAKQGWIESFDRLAAYLATL